MKGRLLSDAPKGGQLWGLELMGRFSEGLFPIRRREAVGGNRQIAMAD